MDVVDKQLFHQLVRKIEMAKSQTNDIPFQKMLSEVDRILYEKNPLEYKAAFSFRDAH